MTEKLIIVLDGGLVQGVTGTGGLVGCKVTVIDYDTDGADEDETTQVDQGDGSVADAFVQTEEVGAAAIPTDDFAEFRPADPVRDAAPDMLAVLKAMQKFYSPMRFARESDDARSDELDALALAAIAKAEGNAARGEEPEGETASSKQHLHMHDYRLGPEGNVEVDETVDKRFWSTLVEIAPHAITVKATSPDGDVREVWIEINDGALVAHCYDSGHEEPLNVRIGASEIVTDDDREGEAIRHD
jgi:hypothetical protein